MSSPTEQTHQLVGLYWIACPAPENRNETIGPSPSKTSWFARSRRHPAPEGTMQCRTPLMRFIKVPLRRISAACPLRSEDPAGKMPTPQHVPSMPFLTTTTGYSAQHPAGLLHPATDHRVRLVLPDLECRSTPCLDPPERRCTPRSVSLFASRAAVTRHGQVHSVSPTDRPLTPLRRCHSARCHAANLHCSTSGS